MGIVISHPGLTDKIAAYKSRMKPYGRQGYVMLLAGPIHQYLQSRARAMFQYEQGPEGDAWAPLAPATHNWRRSAIKRGETAPDVGPEHPINRRTGDLEDAMTTGGPSILAGASSLVLSFPGDMAQAGREAKFSQAQNGRGTSPARPVIGLGADDLGQIMVLANRFFAEGRLR